MLLPLLRRSSIVALSLWLGVPAAADQVPGVSARVRAAQDVLFAAYPDLADTRPSLAIDELGDTVRLVVQTGADVLPVQPRPHSRPHVSVSVAVAFDADGEWRSFDATGPLVKSDDYDALRQRVTKQPFRSAAESRAWLAERRAAFGPDRAPVLDGRLDVVTLGRVLKGEVSMQPGTFQWVEPDTDARVMPGWTAIVTKTKGAGPAVSFRVVFEPFSGRVVRMVRE